MINPSNDRKLVVRGAHDKGGFYVDNLTEIQVSTIEDMWAILQKGDTNRNIGPHLLNEYSSRSHAILAIHIETNEQVGGKLVFVDLAGSENIKVTEAKGNQIAETKKINKSLLALGK